MHNIIVGHLLQQGFRQFASMDISVFSCNGSNSSRSVATCLKQVIKPVSCDRFKCLIITCGITSPKSSRGEALDIYWNMAY